jgi:hypothetical protein
LELDHTILTRLLPTIREMVTIFVENASNAKVGKETRRRRGGEA